MGWRSEVRDNYVTTLEAFAAANPTLTDHVYRSRPESLAETRSIFVGNIGEVIDLDAGTWRRVVDVDILCTRHLSDNQENVDELETTADTLIEWLALNDHAHVLGDSTEQHPIRSREVDLPDGPAFIPAIAITCRASIQQGRT